MKQKGNSKTIVICTQAYFPDNNKTGILIKKNSNEGIVSAMDTYKCNYLAPSLLDNIIKTCLQRLTNYTKFKL